MAVKVAQVKAEHEALLMEGALGVALAHPNLVRSFKWGCAPSAASATTGGTTAEVDHAGDVASRAAMDDAAWVRQSTFWLVLEFCDQGTLRAHGASGAGRGGEALRLGARLCGASRRGAPGFPRLT